MIIHFFKGKTTMIKISKSSFFSKVNHTAILNSFACMYYVYPDSFRKKSCNIYMYIYLVHPVCIIINTPTRMYTTNLLTSEASNYLSVHRTSEAPRKCLSVKCGRSYQRVFITLPHSIYTALHNEKP